MTLLSRPYPHRRSSRFDVWLKLGMYQRRHLFEAARFAHELLGTGSRINEASLQPPPEHQLAFPTSPIIDYRRKLVGTDRLCTLQRQITEHLEPHLDCIIASGPNLNGSTRKNGFKTTLTWFVAQDIVLIYPDKPSKRGHAEKRTKPVKQEESVGRAASAGSAGPGKPATQKTKESRSTLQRAKETISGTGNVKPARLTGKKAEPTRSTGLVNQIRDATEKPTDTKCIQVSGTTSRAK